MRLVVLALLVGVGCATPVDIRGEDREMFLPTARIFVSLVSDEGADEKRVRGVFGIEGALTGGEGEFDMDLAPGEVVQAGGGTIAGPATVFTEFQFIEASLAARGGVRLKSGVNFQGLAGLGYHRTKADLKGPSQRLIKTAEEWGPVIGLHVGWEVASWLEIYGRGTILWMDEFNLGQSQQVEVGAQFNISEHVSLIAAYRWWRVKQEDIPFLTDIDIRGGGAVVGIVIRF